MLEDYLKRVYPNMDMSGAADKKAGRHKKRSESRKDTFMPLTADEKSNICSNQLDAVLQLLSDVERKGQDEIAEVRAPLPRLLHHPLQRRAVQLELNTQAWHQTLDAILFLHLRQL